MAKKRVTRCQMPHIPVNRDGFAPDEAERLLRIREERKKRSHRIDPQRY